MGLTEDWSTELDELSRTRLAEGRSILAGLAADYDALQAAAIAERDEDFLTSDRGQVARPARAAAQAWQVTDRLAGLTAEQLRCLLFALAERLARGGEEYSAVADWYAELTDIPLGLTAGDVRVLAVVAEPGAGSEGYRPFELVIDMVEELLTQQSVGAEALAEAVADQVLDWNVMVYHWWSADEVLRGRADPEWDHRSEVADLRDRALELAGRPPAPPPLEGPVGRDDAFGRAVIGCLGVVEDWPAGVAALLGHCATARTPRPGPRWEKTCRQHLARVDDPSGLLRQLLQFLLDSQPVSYLTGNGRLALLVAFNEQLIRGIVWAAGLLDPPWLPDLLGPVAVRCLRLCSGHVFRDTAVQGEKIPYACFRALATSGSDASLIALARIGRATANGRVLKQLAKTIEEVSAQRGMSAAALLEHLTPDHDLDPDGQMTIDAEGGRWIIQLDDTEGAVAVGPAGTDVPAPVTELIAEIKVTVATVRARLDALFADYRQWHAEDFADSWVRHPLAGWLARRLVWTFTPPGRPPIRGFPSQFGDTVRSPQGTLPIPPGCLVELTHPVTLADTELAGLRYLCAAERIIQPVRQLWRETYRLTPAERQTGLYSDRYGGHILRFSQCYGLARRRGWLSGFLSGAWDGGDSAIARRDYPAAGLRACWAIGQLDDLSHEVAVELCVTERVWFAALGDTVPAPVPLADIPAEVFSEAMRDLDLVVSVSTVANDPIWLESYRGQPSLDQYWDRIAHGGLDQARAARHEILTPFCTGPAAGRYKLTDRDLIVKGSLASYRIDLATANVRMEPAGKWLSFDTSPEPAAAYRHDILGLPAVDDDEILHRILIRAAILADDEQLASRKLLKQIRG
ncbi:MAG TPA: DUF4132 domain-containing protein [Streptosporangiaceae bacterium]|nr:DUF4132 domain-containing protein [Streptosporangiaceae bacterium]